MLLHRYVPKSSDSIDKAVASFVNTHPEKDKMKIMFLRESEGVYQFGQRRVFMKIEKGNQLRVKVGGGFMNVQDFIDGYQRTEMERISRNDVI